MDSISMYDELKEKHSRQEALLKEPVTDKLTNVDIGAADTFDVRKKVHVDGNSKAVSAKSVFMSVYGKEYVDRLATTDASQITGKANLKKIATLSVKTMDNAENLDTVHRYSVNNTERNEKTRNKHREKVHQHANQLVLCSGVHRDAISKCDALMEKEVLTADEKKTLKKEFMKRYKLDLEVIEQEYQMNKNLVLMGGKKDVSEEDSLFRLKYTRYAKAIAANKKGIKMAEKYPDLFDAASFQKQLSKLEKKMEGLGGSASKALMESKRSYFIHSHTRRESKLTIKRAEETAKRNVAEIKAKFGERMQGAIDAYIAKKVEAGLETEVTWLREMLTVDGLAEAMNQGKGSDVLLKNNHKPGRGDKFLENFDQAMELFISRFLFDKATEIPAEDMKALKRGGIPAEGLDRSVRTQLHPVRRLRNGDFVSAEDEQNEAFNRKYIGSLLNNNMDDRRECIEENFRMVYTYNCNMDKFTLEDYYQTDSWKKFMMARIHLGGSNLITDNFAAGGSIMDSKEIASEIFNRLMNGRRTVMVDGKNWDYANFITHLFGFYSILAHGKFNVDPGTCELTTDATAGSLEVREYFEKQLKTFADGYRGIQNNAGGQQ